MEKVLAELREGRTCVRAVGMPPLARARAVRLAVAHGVSPWVCVAADEEAADRLEKDLRFFFGPDAAAEVPRLLRVPADEILPYDELSPERDTAMRRLAALYHLHLGTGAQVVVVSARALSRRVVPRAALDRVSTIVARDQDTDRDALARLLAQAGYDNVPLVEDPGTFAVRGGVVDVFSPLYGEPARIEFFGDTVESIRFFDPATQRTLREAPALHVAPAREVLFDDASVEAAVAKVRAAADAVDHPSRKLREVLDRIGERVPFFGMEALLPAFYAGALEPLAAYLPAKARFFLDDPFEIDRATDELHARLDRDFQRLRGRGDLALEPALHFATPAETRAAWPWNGAPRFESLGLEIGDHPETIHVSLPASAAIRREIEVHHGESGALEPLVHRLKDWRERGLAACIACHSAGSADRIKRLLADRHLQAATRADSFPDDPAALYAPHLHAHLFVGEISAGYVDAASGFALLSDEDVFGPRAERKTKARSKDKLTAAAIEEFRELKQGDLVVHVEHGISRYHGLTKLNVRGYENDFLVLQFAGADKLYLPVQRLRLVQKYAGADAEKVRLDSLGSQSFERRKSKVREEVLQMAAELVDLYAARAAYPGTPFSAPDAYFRQFEADFEFEETPDQARAIEDVLQDMQQPRPMDRLVCGDVGYGKTEVALRAAFKAVQDRKQVAVLVPTTVLAQQHYETFRRRFKDYPVNVEMVSRFRTPLETRAILQRAREGGVDVLIGTHRLLSNDISFKDLGLLVVDEEHRFGMKHKEALKKLRKTVDVLTLTATPIPRTLHMSMSGIRDLSLITTAPEDRRAIRTFVSRFEREVVKEAIERELARGGQVFYLHNRVHSIGMMHRYLTQLVPKARVAVAHGQMAEGKLEHVMTEFVERKHDVLLCTSIIESGLDIPSANTIVIERADTFGLAQLYQIRGRVGRSRERAYAYLLLPARKGITRDAQKRLQVLQEHTDLGAGFRIASHDLEIRGAGNLLGPDQSGQIAAVGFDLYSQLLDEAVAELRGQPLRPEIDPDVQLAVPALIPETYLPDVQQRLLYYKKLAQAGSPEEIADVRAELVDLCGEPPPEVDTLCELMEVKADLRALRLRALESGPGRLVLTLGPDAALDPEKVARLVAKTGKRLTPDLKLVSPIEPGTQGTGLLQAARRLLNELSACAIRP